MIRNVTLLPGLPGDPTDPVFSFSTIRSVLTAEGLCLSFEENDSSRWIGRFDNAQQQSSLPPLLTVEGVALVAAGPFLYAVTDHAQFTCIQSDNAQDRWTQTLQTRLNDANFYLYGSQGGKIVALDDKGLEVAATHIGMGPCEGIVFDHIDQDALSGRFHEFIRDAWLPFRLSVPNLQDQ